MRSKNAMLNIITNLILELIIVLYGFVVPKLIIKTFGSDVNGLISSITHFLNYIALLESGFGPVVKATLYKPIAAKNNKEIANILKSTEKFFKIISYIFIIYIVGLAIIYPSIINNEFNYVYSSSLIIIISISTFAEYYFGMTYRLYLQANQKKYIISIVQIVTYIINIILIVFLVKLNVSIHFIKLITGLVFVLRPIFQNIYVKKKYSINFKEANNNYKIKNKWDGLAQHIAAVIHGNTDVTLLTIFGTLSQVSIYSVYYMVISGIKSIIMSFSNGIESIFGDMNAKQEKKNLKEKFDLYEMFYLNVCAFLYGCSFVLIVPFVQIYTKNITDINYINYSFGFFMVLSGLILAFRIPYSTLTLSVGHFKETRIGAWIEAFINLFLSLVLIQKYNIVGIVIATCIATLIRTIEFIYHSNKYILNRYQIISYKKIVLCLIEIFVLNYIIKFINFSSNLTYINWIFKAFITALICIIIIIIFNLVFYHKNLNQIIDILRKRGAKHDKKNY